MSKLCIAFNERYADVEEYIKFLLAIDKAVKNGNRKFGGDEDYAITPLQQKILYSSVYLQLYNLIEATICHCIQAVEDLLEKSNIQPSDLSPQLQCLWVRFTAETHKELNQQNRHNKAMNLFHMLRQQSPVKKFDIDKGGGGNWTDMEIQNFANRIGMELTIPDKVYNLIKKHIRNDMGPMKLVVDLRNQLSHGSITFTTCGENNSAQELKELSEIIANYLREVIKNFESYIKEQHYLQLSERGSYLTPAI